MAEMQNNPKPPAIAGEVVLSSEEIRRKVNGRQPGEVPKGCECLTAFIDVHDDLFSGRFAGGNRTSQVTGLSTGAFQSNPNATTRWPPRSRHYSSNFSGGGKGIGHLRRARILRSGLARATTRETTAARCRSAGC